MSFVILLFPLISALFSGFFGNFFGVYGVTFFSTLCIFIAFLFSFVFFYLNVVFGKVTTFFIFPWIKTSLLCLNWGFLFDSLTAIIFIVVCSVSIFVHFYSISYIDKDPHLIRFITYLSFFTFFILILVSADNFVQIFVGWEGVGLCSYLLINFWFTRLQANKAAIKAILVNRVGDFGLSLGIFLIFVEYGALDYSTVFSLIPFSIFKSISFFGFSVYILDLIAFFLFIGSVGKSAQIGLHTWLPDAIEGPTPVSALIHAATIVTAGVFLLVRCSPLFEFSPNILKIITIFGSITAFFAATTGLFQNDLKKVIAYSTCSQLGYIIFACGLSSYNVGLFHLANHAFFKALLFLTAGSVIHAINDEQDMRKIGGLAKLLPFSYSIILIGSLALMGFPFLSGFYSKDFILEVAFGSYKNISFFAYNLGVLAAFFTAFYSIRSLHLTFLSNPRGFKKNYEVAHEGSFFLTFPLFVLGFGSLFFGYLIKDLVIGFGSSFFNNSLFVLPMNFVYTDSEFLPLSVKIIPLFFSFFGFFISFFLYTFYNKLLFIIKISSFGRYLYYFFNKKWFFDKIYNQFIVINYLFFSYKSTYKNLDKGFLEWFGPFGISNNTSNFAQLFSNFQTGHLFHYLLLIVFCFIFYFFFYFFFLF